MEPTKEVSSLYVTPKRDLSDSSLSNAPNTEDEHPHKSRYQKVYNAFGFTKGYNFPLYILFAGAIFAFSLSRFETLNPTILSTKILRPGLWWAIERQKMFKVAIFMHIAGAVPAGFLVAFQFTPIIRHKFMLFHRINGYTILLLILVSNIGCCILLIRPLGTDIAWQTVISMLIIFTTFSGGMAIWNIKKLQIDQHRAWMLRCMFVLGTSVTGRIIGLSGAYFMTRLGGWYTVVPCAMIDFTNRQFGIEGVLETKYPACLTGNETMNGNVVVAAALNATAPEETGSAYAVMAGPSVWLALILHVVGLELYLHLTPREARRLRQVSYEKQVAAGMRNPGYAGTTVERFGDAEKWHPDTVY